MNIKLPKCLNFLRGIWQNFLRHQGETSRTLNGSERWLVSVSVRTVKSILCLVKLFGLAPVHTKSPGPSLSGLFNTEFRSLLHLCLAIALLSLAICLFIYILFFETITQCILITYSLIPVPSSPQIHPYSLPADNSMSSIQCNDSVSDPCYLSNPECEAIGDQRTHQWPS